MKNKPIIIEFTGLQGSGKTTILNKLKQESCFFDKNILICDYVKQKYIKQNFFKRIILNIFTLFNNINIYIDFFYISFKCNSKYQNTFEWFKLLSSNLTLLKYIEKKSFNKVILFDEFLIHQLIHSLVNSNIKNKKNLLISILKKLNINMIYFDIPIDIALERLKNRKRINSKWDNMSDEWKKNIVIDMQKNYKSLLKEYSKLKSKLFKINGDRSIEKSTKQVIKHIEFIINK